MSRSVASSHSLAPRSVIRRGLANLATLLTLASLAGAAPVAAFDHTAWNDVVARYVDADGRVAYRDLASQDRGKLQRYLDQLAVADPSSLARRDRLAFWINAYNAMVVAGILDGYRAESTFGRYRFFRSYTRRIAGKDRSLDDIEHGVIRGELKDFRAHFAVNCASASCPVLRNEAYAGAQLDAQLESQAQRFLRDPTRNRFDTARRSVKLSRIFDWFAADFTAEGRTLADTLAPYLTDEQRKLLRTSSVDYLAYDWTLNAQPGQRP